MENYTLMDSTAVPALQQLIQEFYAPYTDHIAISVYGSEHCAIWRIRDFLHELQWRLVNLKYSIEEGRANESSGHKFDNRQFNVIIIDGLDALEYLDPAAHTRNYDVQEFYLVQLLNKCDTEFKINVTTITDILKYFWKNFLINVSVLVESSKNTNELYTYFPFASNQRCKVVTLKRINRFKDIYWQKNTLLSVFPNKVHNFNRCPLKIAIYDVPPYLRVRYDKTGLISVAHFEGTLLLELSKKLNFSMDFVIPPNNELRGKVLPNGSTTGALKLLQQRQADLSLGCFRYTLERVALLTAALPYYQTWQIYGVLRTSQPYSSLEILSFAFDVTTWFCLCCSIQVVVWITFLLQRERQNFRLAHLIMGVPKTRTPCLNIFAIFLGYPLVRLPRNTFTRYVIILWFIFGIMLRNAYQALLYKLLRTNLYRKLPQTLDDLIAQGYGLVMIATTYDSIHTVQKIQGDLINIITINSTTDLSTFAYVEATKDKLLAGVSPKDFFTYYMMQKNRTGLFYALPEKIFAQHITMYFSKHSYLTHRFDQLFMFLRGQGMIDYWARRNLNEKYFQDALSNLEVNGITLQRISGIFVIHAVLLCVACCVFSLELAWWKYKRYRRVLKRNRRRQLRKLREKMKK